jgi:hypothetical protein
MTQPSLGNLARPNLKRREREREREREERREIKMLRRSSTVNFNFCRSQW